MDGRLNSLKRKLINVFSKSSRSSFNMYVSLFYLDRGYRELWFSAQTYVRVTDILDLGTLMAEQ